MGTPNTIVPEVLTEENYARWKIWMKSYLLSEEVWDIVMGTEAKPDEAKKKAFKTWRKKNAKALHAIQVSCGPKALSSISEKDTAKDAWDSLASLHEPEETSVNPQQPSEPSSAYPQGQSRDEVTWHSLLYKAVVNGDWESTKKLLGRHPEALSARLSMGETILHIAVLHDQVAVVQELVKLMPIKELEAVAPNRNDATALHFAVFGGVVKIAEAMVNKNPNLLCIKDQSGRTPVNIASFSGHKDMLRYLYSVTPEEQLTSEQGIEVFTNAIVTEDYEFALEIHRRFPQLTTVQDITNWTALETLAKKPYAFPSGVQLRFWQRWIYMCINLQSTSVSNSEDGILRRVPGFKQMQDLKLKNIQALELLKRMSKQVSTFDSSQIEASAVINAIKLASQFGTVELFVEMVKANPALLRVNSKSLNVFHLAIANRQEKTWNLIYGLGARKSSDWGTVTDGDSNTMLHAAGKLAPANRLNNISGAAMQMQWELQWFKDCCRR
uniref:Uncharacterized protein n=1 Tax=Davidia involucrata TaxID=16924 RepID=A0A5B7APG1_DAVIN